MTTCSTGAVPQPYCIDLRARTGTLALAWFDSDGGGRWWWEMVVRDGGERWWWEMVVGDGGRRWWWEMVVGDGGGR
eukprot:203864-Prorocentrum_minimum.AAC.1